MVALFLHPKSYGSSFINAPGPVQIKICQALSIGTFGHRRAPNPATVFQAGVFGDDRFPARRTVRKKLAHPSGEILHIVAIQFCPPDGCPFSGDVL